MPLLCLCPLSRLVWALSPSRAPHPLLTSGVRGWGVGIRVGDQPPWWRRGLWDTGLSVLAPEGPRKIRKSWSPPSQGGRGQVPCPSSPFPGAPYPLSSPTRQPSPHSPSSFYFPSSPHQAWGAKLSTVTNPGAPFPDPPHLVNSINPRGSPACGRHLLPASCRTWALPPCRHSWAAPSAHVALLGSSHGLLVSGFFCT